MIRQAARGALALLLVAAVLDSTGRGQAGAGTDKLYFRDKKDNQVRSAEGELKMSPAGIQVISAGKVIATVAPSDVVKVTPGDLPGLDRLKDVLPPLGLEDKREWEKARAVYLNLQKQYPNPAERSRRFLEYKVAVLSARIADETREEDGWDVKAKDAVGQLERFLAAYTSGWELWGVGRTLARIQGELGKYPDAAATWAKLAKNPETPPDLKLEATLQEIDAAVRGARYADAVSRAAELAKTATTGPTKDRVAIYQAAADALGKSSPLDAIGPLEKAIADSKDPAVRATGYSMLGELYLAAGKPRDAMWAFLWVEVVYTHDRDEVLKAVARLATVFQMQGDEERVKAYREKLRKYRSAL
jgi:hypothetical protein